MDVILGPWKRYADFTGRARRTEFFLFWILLLALSFVWLMVGGIMSAIAAASTTGRGSDAAVGLILFAPLFLFWLAALIPSIAVTVRRMHDQDQTGWLSLLTWLPFFIGCIFVLVFGFIPGTAGDNRYGRDPRGGIGQMERVFG